MDKIPVVVVGPFGKKLGRPVCDALLAVPDEFELVAGIVSPNDDGNRDHLLPDVQMVKNFQQIKGEVEFLSDQLVVIDEPAEFVVFYAVKAAAMIDRFSEAVNCGFERHVIGSTALTKTTIDHLKILALPDRLVLVWAPNFSVGANIGAEQCADLAARFPEYHAEIVEAHHWQKEDAPSGTALMWARAIAAARGQDFEKVVHYARYGTTGKRRPEEIGIVSVRGGSVTGYHKATFYGPNDEISVEHNVRSSALFAQGALRAIRWAAAEDRRPGFYGMPHVLGLSKLIELGLA